ncbi:MAG: helix-turn-helix transcriptional regulator [Phycisphaerales bacterium]|nr:helix-turn-helix transcriptional regulator [Phycisphaerales bacterium]
MAKSPELGQDLFAGLIPLHILHHAAEKPVYGLWVIEELGRHGYRLSAGTLYPLLHRLEKRGLLRSESARAGRRVRRVYRITPDGRRALRAAKQKVKELFGELFESELHSVFGDREHRRQQSPRDRPASGRTSRGSAEETNPSRE